STGYTPPLPDFGQFDGLHMHRLTHRDLTVQLGLSDWAHVLTCVADEWHDAGYTDGHRLLVFEEFARNEWLEGYREVALFLGQSAVLGEEAYAYALQGLKDGNHLKGRVIPHALNSVVMVMRR